MSYLLIIARGWRGAGWLLRKTASVGSKALCTHSLITVLRKFLTSFFLLGMLPLIRKPVKPLLLLLLLLLISVRAGRTKEEQQFDKAFTVAALYNTITNGIVLCTLAEPIVHTHSVLSLCEENY